MKIFRADYVFPVCADPIKNGVVTVDDSGKIINVSDDIPRRADPASVKQLSGIICPGFINTHCHVELSHLRDKIPMHGGLVPFIKNIQQHRRRFVPYSATQIASKNHFLLSKKQSTGSKPAFSAICSVCKTVNFCEISM